MGTYTIRYLNEDEKKITRPFWEAVFDDDSERFLNYYYQERVRDNRILVKLSGDKPVSMLHLNPYRWNARGRRWTCNYIVAVATDSGERHRGHMRDLLHRALADMDAQGMPFTYLMPASEAIYRPFDFTYVYDQKAQEFVPDRGLVFREAGRQDFGLLKRLSEELLRPGYDLYALRDDRYLELLYQEVTCDKGGIEIAYGENDEAVGYLAWWGDKKREIRCLYGKEGYVRTVKEEPAIMARIVNLPAFLEMMTASRSMSLPLWVEDDILSSNQGAFMWHLGPEGSWLEREEGLKAASAEGLRISIRMLTAWLFGYMEAEDVAAATGCSAELLKHVRGFQNVLMDEIV